MDFRSLLAGCALAAACGSALACGVCIDDKVAAAYDHDVVQRAVKAGRQVVFVELSGPQEARALTASAKKAVASMPGVDPGSIRASEDLPIISFVIEPTRQQANASVEALRASLVAEQVVPVLLRILPTGG